MRVSSIQLEMKDGQVKEQMIDHALAMMEKARGSDLILLPEIWNIGFFAYDRYVAESEAIDGPTATALAAKAKDLGCYVFSGSFVESRDGKHYNTSLLFDREGKRIGEYRKIHLFSYQSREPEILTAGRDIAVVPTEFGPFGLSTCYDLRFPELYRAMVDGGAEFFLVTSGWPFPRLAHWLIFNQARAVENSAFLFSCNACGVQSGIRFLGHSQIVDPWGIVAAGSGHDPAIVTADVDPSLVTRTRREFPALRDRVL